MPTFQNILQTLAPPISQHERLAIHITHDLSGYPTLDPTIYAVFSRVMSQVEGGDLMVVQRGQEASPSSHPDDSNSGETKRKRGGWTDGPWWRDVSTRRSVNAISGARDGSKLARASAESYAAEYFSSRGGSVEEAAKNAARSIEKDTSNPTRDSDIFLSVQAILTVVDKDVETQKHAESKEGGAVEVPEQSTEICFAIYLHDPVHGIAFSTISQAVPVQWIEWLDASAETADELPQSIAEIIESGGVDPREWVSEWIEETLSLAVGVVAQRYVARRMGVGEGGVGRGKMKAGMAHSEIVEGGGGEMARAMGGM